MCAFSCWLHFSSPFDLQLQRIFFSDHKWLIDPHDAFFYFFFYNLPKIIIVFFALTSLVMLILHSFKILRLQQRKTVGLLTFLLCALFFPVFINVLKEILQKVEVSVLR